MELERRHIRLPVNYRVYIDSDGETGGEAIEVCQALDVSRSGIRLGLDRELAVNAFIHLGVEASGAAPLILVAVVRWCRPREDEATDTTCNWCAGLELQPAPGSDYRGWCDLLEELEG